MQYTGAIPLGQQETFALALKELRQTKNDLMGEIKAAEQLKAEAESSWVAAKHDRSRLQELLQAVQDPRSVERMAEWHQRMSALQLSELQLSRQLEHAQQRERHLSATIGTEQTSSLIFVHFY